MTCVNVAIIAIDLLKSSNAFKVWSSGIQRIANRAPLKREVVDGVTLLICLNLPIYEP